jgi:FlgD Ig-like domain
MIRFSTLAAAMVAAAAFPAPGLALPQVSVVLAQGSLANDAVSVGPDGRIYCSYFLFGTQPRQVLRTTPDGASEVFVSFGASAGPLGSTFDAAGNLYVANLTFNRVHRIDPDGVKSVWSDDASLVGPADLEFHPSGNGDLYVTVHNTAAVVIIHADQTVDTFYDGPLLNQPHTGTFDSAGNFYVMNINASVVRITPDGTASPFTNAAEVGYLHCTGDRLFHTALNLNQVFEISLADGSVSWVAGSGVAGFTEGPADVAQLHSPNGITAAPGGHTLYVSSGFGNGLFRIDLDSAVSAPVPAGAGGLRLGAPVPNPFRDRTVFAFDVPSPVAVDVTVYDVTGRTVRRLARDAREAGRHTVTWDGTTDSGDSVASGVYLVRLRAGGEADVRRVTLSR